MVRELAQWDKCLLPKCVFLNSDSQNLHTSQMWWYISVTQNVSREMGGGDKRICRSLQATELMNSSSSETLDHARQKTEN